MAAALGVVFFLEHQDPRKGRNTLRSLCLPLFLYTHISHSHTQIEQPGMRAPAKD